MDAPKRIYAWSVPPTAHLVGTWSVTRYPDAAQEYIIASDHARIVAEKDARITVMRKALMAFEQHEASHFRGPDAEKNRRQSYRGVKRAVRAALKGDSDE